MGKTFKYLFWGGFTYFLYHLFLVVKNDKPESWPLANEFFLDSAFIVKMYYRDFYELLTLPPVKSLLLEHPDLPGMQKPPKTLVLNLEGTLIHSEYKMGIGFEILKRPGLSIFLQQMANHYEVVIFGEQENGVSRDVIERLLRALSNASGFVVNYGNL